MSRTRTAARTTRPSVSLFWVFCVSTLSTIVVHANNATVTANISTTVTAAPTAMTSTGTTTTSSSSTIVGTNEEGDITAIPPSPRQLTFRVGLLHAPPFAIIEEDKSEVLGGYKFDGFSPDLLRAMVGYARIDNVVLNIEMSLSPPQYTTAFDLVANDCLELRYNEANCTQFDILGANFYGTPSRSVRAGLSPPLLRSTISTVKYIDKSPNSKDYTTFAEVEEDGATVCIKEGTFYANLVKTLYPRATYHMCPDVDSCLDALKTEQCVLSADDELQIRYRVARDPTLDITRESFNTQYIVWAIRHDLPTSHVQLFEKWMWAANMNRTNEILYSQYFQKALCPVGTAGESCELPCDPNFGEANARGECVCISSKYTGDDCSIEIPENVNLIPLSLKVIAYIMLAMNVITIAICATWLYWKRDTFQVRVSQPSFLLLVLVGCLISSCTIIVLAQEDAEDGPVRACLAIPWLYSMGFSVTFGTLFAKIRRVYHIFKSARDGVATRNNVISVKETLAVIGTVLLVDVSILVVWSVVDPLHWSREVTSSDKFGTPLESQGRCVSDYWLLFAGAIALLHLALMAVACYLCYVARDIPTQFSEGKYVSIAMISNLQIFVIGVPILIIIGTDPQSSFFVRSVIIWMNDFVVVTLIFGNLMYSVHFDTAIQSADGIRQTVVQHVSGISSAETSQKRNGSSPSIHSRNSRGGKASKNRFNSKNDRLDNSSNSDDDDEISEAFAMVSLRSRNENLINSVQRRIETSRDSTGSNNGNRKKMETSPRPRSTILSGRSSFSVLPTIVDSKYEREGSGGSQDTSGDEKKESLPRKTSSFWDSQHQPIDAISLPPNASSFWDSQHQPVDAITLQPNSSSFWDNQHRPVDATTTTTTTTVTDQTSSSADGQHRSVDATTIVPDQTSSQHGRVDESSTNGSEDIRFSSVMNDDSDIEHA